MGKWLTPEDPSPANTVCRTIVIPDDMEWRAIVNGCLSLITDHWNFEQHGTATPQEVAERFTQMFHEFLAADCEPAMPETIILADVQSSATPGGTFTSGAWRTRTLNTEVLDTGGNCSLSGNQFTLDAGEYELRAFCPAYLVSGHIARLYNVTDSTVLATSNTAYSGAGTESMTILYHRFTITAQKTFRIDHRCDNTVATYGFGVNNSWGDGNKYTQVFITKLG